MKKIIIIAVITAMSTCVVSSKEIIQKEAIKDSHDNKKIAADTNYVVVPKGEIIKGVYTQTIS